MPLISVLMPVYNGMPHLKEAVDSILNQDFRDFELIVINDGSRDDSAAYIQSMTDPRIVLVDHSRNIGLIGTLNEGLKLARGEYIARMDQDDIAHPDRLSVQLRFLTENPEIGMCGSFANVIGEDRVIRHPENHEDLRIALLSNNPFIHPSVMMRAGLIRQFGLKYHDEYKSAEDYHFWYTMSTRVKLANIPKTLLSYRIHEGQISSSDAGTQVNTANRVRTDCMADLVGRPLTQVEKDVHIAFVLGVNPAVDIGALWQWKKQMSRENKHKQSYPEPAFEQWLNGRMEQRVKEVFLWSCAPFGQWMSVLKNPGILPAMSVREWIYSLKKSIIKNGHE